MARRPIDEPSGRESTTTMMMIGGNHDGGNIILQKPRRRQRRRRDRHFFAPILFACSFLQAASAFQALRQPTFLTSTRRHSVTFRDADFTEMMVGGEKYEMVPLPDSMVDRTLFVGNLNEFVQDGDLSDLFQSVSVSRSLPACVVRKPNMQSLEYGFVSFPSISEKEDAILRFHLSEFRGKRIKVEEIRDHPKFGRVRVPEKIVEYCSGSIKKVRKGVNTMREVRKSTPEPEATHRRKKYKKKNKKAMAVASSKLKSLPEQIYCPDKTPKQMHDQLKKKIKATIQQNNKRHRFPPHRLEKSSLDEFHRASRKGFLSLSGTGFRRGRKTNALANTHRQWCDERDKPQVVLCKASGGRPLDNVIVDLSPLRMNVLADGDLDKVNELLLEWKTQVVSVAAKAGMVLRNDYLEDSCGKLSIVPCEDGTNIELTPEDPESSEDRPQQNILKTVSTQSWSTKPIFQLPSLSMGVFEGERAQAKAMARELAILWDIPAELPAGQQEKTSKGKHKYERRKEHNRTGRNTRSLDWYL